MNSENFSVIKALNVIWFDAKGKAQIDKLPMGATYTTTGGRSISGCIEILHSDRLCYAFEQDLREPLREGERHSQAQEESGPMENRWSTCRLTPRQKDILCLIAEDLTAKEIADELSISPKTVEFHKEILRKKIGKVGTAGLVRLAIRNDILRLRVQSPPSGTRDRAS